MDIEQKERLAHRGDMGMAASAIRLRAARVLSGVDQSDVASACGIRNTSYSNMETGRSFPSRDVMRYFFRMHRIDFNFLMAGDFAGLPSDLLSRLFPALLTANAEQAAEHWVECEITGPQLMP